MAGIVVRWLILTTAIIIASYVIEGIHVGGFLSALFTGATLGILNAVFRPILLILTLPINVMTFGLFTFIINALLLKMASGVIPGFEVHGFWSAVFGSLIISFVTWALSVFIYEHGRIRRTDYIELKKRDDDSWG